MNSDVKIDVLIDDVEKIYTVCKPIVRGMQLNILEEKLIERGGEEKKWPCSLW